MRVHDDIVDFGEDILLGDTPRILLCGLDEFIAGHSHRWRRIVSQFVDIVVLSFVLLFLLYYQQILLDLPLELVGNIRFIYLGDVRFSLQAVQGDIILSFVNRFQFLF